MIVRLFRKLLCKALGHLWGDWEKYKLNTAPAFKRQCQCCEASQIDIETRGIYEKV